MMNIVHFLTSYCYKGIYPSKANDNNLIYIPFLLFYKKALNQILSKWIRNVFCL